MTTFKISHRDGYTGKFVNHNVLEGQFNMDELKKKEVYGLSAFMPIDTSRSERDALKEKMSSLRDALNWESGVSVKEYSSDAYGTGWAININVDPPKATVNEFNSFISSLAGSASI
tara:strand:- start:1508 stop:1855 length:348 start_codon:yes stop_codon:yes gene_type:complete